MANVNFPTANSQKVQTVWYDDYSICEEGGYFVATNPTVGTAITGTICVDDAATASSTHAQYAPFVLMFNTQPTASLNPYNVYLKYMKFMNITPPANATLWQYSLRMDPVNRWSSGGTAITPVNPNPMSQHSSSVIQLNAGALVPTALPSNSSRLLSHGNLASTITVLNSQYLIRFGNSQMKMDQIGGGTVAQNVSVNAPPCVLPPGWGLAFEWWGASSLTTASTWEFEVAWVERIPGL